MIELVFVKFDFHKLLPFNLKIYFVDIERKNLRLANNFHCLSLVSFLSLGSIFFSFKIKRNFVFSKNYKKIYKRNLKDL